jgi:Fur family ferric uptake transcriptional regulator
MKPLSHFPSETNVFVLELSGSEDDVRHLQGIGVRPEVLVTIVKNEMDSQKPVIIEIQGARFLLERETAEGIIASSALENQEAIFHGNKTKQRDLILDILQKFPGHFSLKEFTHAIQKQDPSIGEITVYRTIKTLLEKGILQEISLPQGEKKYEIQKGHHDHIFCKNCGNIMEFYNADLEKLQQQIAKEHGITLFSHTMTLVGASCKECC